MHEATPVLRLLEMFRENPVHMAVVVDEYGVLEGIVTPTDILIAIAGELPEDVADLEEAAAVRRDDGSWLIDGMLGIHEAERLLERRTCAATRTSRRSPASCSRGFGRIPQIGDHFEWDGLRFEIVDMDGRRIDRIMVTPAAHAEARARRQ